MLRAPGASIVLGEGKAAGPRCAFATILRRMAGDEYLRQILAREAVDTGPYSPIRAVQAVIYASIAAWAGNKLVSVNPSGSFAKGTSNLSGTDIDLFISLSHTTTETLREIYNKLFGRMQDLGYAPKKQNVSINVNIGGSSVDLVPARRQDAWSQVHSLYRRKADTWTKTNVNTHVAQVSTSGRLEENVSSSSGGIRKPLSSHHSIWSWPSLRH